MPENMEEQDLEIVLSLAAADPEGTGRHLVTSLIQYGIGLGLALAAMSDTAGAAVSTLVN